MNEQLKKGMKVEMLPGMDQVYPHVNPLSHGLVRAVKEDEFGFQKVYIEWDKEHWRYAGEEDRWTFATHFRPIEGEDLVQIDDEPILLKDESSIRIPTSEEYEKMEEYLDALMVACDKASESDGFYLVTLKRENDFIRLEILGATVDEELMYLSGPDLFKFIEQELREEKEEE